MAVGFYQGNVSLFLGLELNVHVQSVCLSVNLLLKRLRYVCVDPGLLHISQDNDTRSCRVLAAKWEQCT